MAQLKGGGVVGGNREVISYNFSILLSLNPQQHDGTFCHGSLVFWSLLLFCSFLSTFTLYLYSLLCLLLKVQIVWH